MGVLPKSLQAINSINKLSSGIVMSKHQYISLLLVVFKYMYVANYQQDVNTFDGVAEKTFGSSCKQLVLLETHTCTTAIQPHLTFVHGCRRDFVNRIYLCLFVVCLFVCFRQDNYINGCSLSKADSCSECPYIFPGSHIYVALDLATSHENKIHVQQHKLRK